MKKWDGEISIRELHINTDHWVKRVGGLLPNALSRVVITDHGNPIAELVPYHIKHSTFPFAKRKLVKGFANIKPSARDSTEIVSEDRER